MDCPGTAYEVRKDGVLYKVYIDAFTPGNTPASVIVPPATTAVVSPTPVKNSSTTGSLNRVTRKNVNTNNQVLPKAETNATTATTATNVPTATTATNVTNATNTSNATKPTKPTKTIFKNPLSQFPANTKTNRNLTFKNTPISAPTLNPREKGRISAEAIRGPQRTRNTWKTPRMPYSVPASKPGILPNNTTNTSRLLPYITKATNTGTLTNQVKVLSNTPVDVEKKVQFKNTPISVPNISQVKKGIISASGKGSQRTNTRTTRRSPLKNLIQQSTNNSNTKKLLSPVSPEIQTRDIPLPGTPNQTKSFE